MARQPSVETQLRTARAEMKELSRQIDRQAVVLSEFRARATKAEQELAEWKARFDLLLKRTPELPL